MIRTIGIGWCAVLLFMVEAATAQLRLIPQSKIDSVRHPRTVENSAMNFLSPTTLDMGSIDEAGSSWTGEVRWKNSGRMPLVVTRVVTTCGCLKAEYERKPLMPDSVAVMHLTYHPKGHPGAVYQRALIYTTLSADRPTAVVTLCGEVVAAADRSDDYPTACGALRLRHAEVSFKGGEERQTARVACLNGGDKPLRLTADTLLTSPALRLHTEPQVLSPGEAGDLVISFDPSKAVFIRPTMLLYMGGLRLPPRQRALTIRIDEE